MQKVSYYIIALVSLGVVFSSAWVYQRYFKAVEQPFLYFTVDRGDIQEAVKVRGEVVAQKQYELEFPFAGTIASIAVADGDAVPQGKRLMTLETKDFEMEQSQLAAVVAEREATLAKLRVGATVEDIRVSESQLASARVAVEEAKKTVVDKIKDAYTKCDDAVRTKTDQLFDNPRSANPTFLSAFTADDRVRFAINQQRQALETTLNNWSASLAGLSASSDLSATVSTAKQDTAVVSMFLNALSPVVSGLSANSGTTQTMIDKYNVDLSAARTNVNSASTNIVAAEEKLKLAEASVVLAQNQLALISAPARSEDIVIAETRINEAQSQFNAVKEKIRRSTLTAPTDGRVTKVNYEIGEVFHPGKPALSMVTTGYKLYADVSELDIAKVRESDGNGIRAQLDAFPGFEFMGNVTTVDAQEVIKTEDKYYRVNMLFDASSTEVRSGMSADVTILASMKKGVLRLPELAIYADGKDKYVQVLPLGLTKAPGEASLSRVQIRTGVTDGTYVEILSGLTEGQTVVVSAE